MKGLEFILILVFLLWEYRYLSCVFLQDFNKIHEKEKLIKWYKSTSIIGKKELCIFSAFSIKIHVPKVSNYLEAGRMYDGWENAEWLKN